jgi:23S rRNA pseudouridine955/2504/2580 synthase
MIVSNKVKNVEINSANDGQRLDNFLISKIKNIPKSHVYRLIRTGQVRVNSARSKPSKKLKIGDIVRIPPYTSTESLKPKISKDLVKKTIKNILYEDKNIIVFNKPSSFSVHSGTGIGYGLIDIIRLAKKDCERIDLLNRLDKDTSGCLIVTKNLLSLRIYQKKLNDNKLEKKYLCLVKGLWDKNIKRNEINLTRGNKTKKALSEYKIIKYFKESTLLEVNLITGRYHQIRKQCALLGHPVIGDSKYGDFDINRIYKRNGLNRIFLHSYSVRIDSKKEKLIKSPMPKELEKFLKLHN